MPSDIVPRVLGILSLAEDACAVFFDPEHTTAALCWIIGRVNDSFHLHGTGVEVQDLMEHFGLTGSPSSRAMTLVRAIGGDVDFAWEGLHTTRYLTSYTRARFMELSRALQTNF